MAYEFKKLSEVEMLEEVPEGASVLAEVDGDIKRVPGNGLGGGTSGYVVTLTSDTFVEVDYTMQCTINYDEMYDVLAAGGIVWLDFSELNGFLSQSMVLSCWITWQGLFVGTPDGDILFTNGSHNIQLGEK